MRLGQNWGESIGYGSTTIANYESGERLPDLITAYAIAQRYHGRNGKIDGRRLHES